MAWRVGRGDDLFCRKDVSYFYASESGIYFEDLMCPPVSLLARHWPGHLLNLYGTIKSLLAGEEGGCPGARLIMSPERPLPALLRLAFSGEEMLCRRKCPLFRFLRRKEGGCLFIRALTGTPTWVCRCKSREKGCCVAGSRYPGPAFMAVVNRCAITVLLIEFMNYDILLSVPVVLCTYFFSVYTQPTKANTNILVYACTRTKRKMDTRCCCFFLWRGICIHRRASFLLVLHKIK